MSLTVKISTPKIIYILELKRNLSVIRGYSGSGKTLLKEL